MSITIDKARDGFVCRLRGASGSAQDELVTSRRTHLPAESGLSMKCPLGAGCVLLPV